MSGPTPSPSRDGLDARVVVRRPAHTLDVAVGVDPGQVLAMVGPNGSGKSTLLRALAGLVPLAEGHVRLGSRTWEEAGASRVPVQDRALGVAFQESLLFPHLSARENVAFGPRSRGCSRTESRARADEWLARLRVADLAERRPHQLSGGQARRVAIARALAADPALLLLDEPFAGLDVGLTLGLRAELAAHLHDFAGIAIVVTHDAVDALALADEIAVLEDGRIAQRGPAAEVAARPSTAHVARLVGLNVLAGHSEGTLVRLPDGSTLVTAVAAYGPVEATFAPSAVALDLAPPAGSARNHWEARVLSVSPLGAAVRVHLDAVGGLLVDVTAESAHRLGLAPGVRVWASVKATEVEVLQPAADGAGSGTLGRGHERSAPLP